MICFAYKFRNVHCHFYSKKKKKKKKITKKQSHNNNNKKKTIFLQFSLKFGIFGAKFEICIFFFWKCFHILII